MSTRRVARQATSAVAYAPGPEPEDDDPLLGFAPFVHPAPRRNSITPELQRRFVATLAATGIVNQAARSIGKSMEALYKLRARPGAEGFAAAWDAALERGVGRLEDCALERALQGTATPIVSGGQLVGYWNKPDNTLLRFLLQHRFPQRYGVQSLGPGNPVYDSIRAEVAAEVSDRLGARHEAEEKAAKKAIADLRRRAEAAEARADYYERKVAEADHAADRAEAAEKDRASREYYRGLNPALTEADLDAIMAMK